MGWGQKLGEFFGENAAKVTNAFGDTGIKEAASFGWNSLGSTAKGAIIGAGVGGILGGISGQDRGGFLGGAVMGAGAGAGFAKFGAGKNLMSNALQSGRKFAAGKALTSNMNSMGGMGVSSVNRSGAGRMAGWGHELLSNRGFNSFAANHGDKALASLGIASAGLIGGSVFSSNRPY